MAERTGFEPAVVLHNTTFPMLHIKPLCHLSKMDAEMGFEPMTFSL